MNIIVTMTTAVACALALTACGGGGGGDDDSSSPSSRADEGIWSNLDNSGAGLGMQAVILSDGTYWGLYGSGQTDGSPFVPIGILQGTSSVSSNSASGSYTDFFETGTDFFKGTYSGTVSPQNSLNLTFNNPSSPAFTSSSGANGSFNMSYDSIYKQPASLTAVAGKYLGRDCEITVGQSSGTLCAASAGPVSGSTTYAVQVTITGSNLTLGLTEVAPNPGADQTVGMNGTLAPHGATGNVFDVNLTATTGDTYVPAGTVFKGILFPTSSGNLEIITTAGNSAFYYIGTKQN
ncbi:MAG: hypothetical protein LBU72_08600 [Burkholderiaceae bacterium]|jgi:hypothetical protein|nr:hypothetical protein [Burkholderiaceae bacterium]